MKSEEEINKLIEQDLPTEIDGFLRRIGSYKDFCTIIYSKDGGFLAKYLCGSHTNDLDYFNKGMLYEVIGKDKEDCYFKIKQKINLNEKVKKDFPKNIIFNFKPNFKYSDGKNAFYLRLFEVYLVLDTNSDSQFLCVVSINPAFDLNYILPIINQLKKQIKEKSFIKLSGEDFNYEDFDLPKVVHFYSEDFNQNKDLYKHTFTQHKWNVKFRDKYFFKKQLDSQKERIILCEGKNVGLLNSLKIPDILFSDEHNSHTIFQNVKTQERYCLRDKDYLLSNEVSKLKKNFPKYYILNYYCIENYLYHPNNIAELELDTFNREDYISDITKQKNDCFLDIVSTIEGIRKGYKELTENFNIKEKDSNRILIEELKSDIFEIFYQHFDMKTKYKRQLLAKHTLTAKKLSSTTWFKNKIKEIINAS